MIREQCNVGMKVVFGRPNGEKTVGEIAEIHETKAKIKALESRGDGNRGSEEHRTKKQPAGSVWDSPFENMEPLNNNLLEALRSLPSKNEQLFFYLLRGSETLLTPSGSSIGKSILRRACMRGDEETSVLQTIVINYKNRKSIAASYWKYKHMRTTEADLEADCLLSEWNDHNHRLGLLFEALGRPVSEAVSYAWESDRRIMNEIDKEFVDPADRAKARQHWRKMHEFFPNDYDYQEKINLWNERRLSPAWIEAGLNKTSQAPIMAPIKPSVPLPFPQATVHNGQTLRIEHGQTVAN